MQNRVVPSFFLTRTISAAHRLVEGLTCDQASLRFFCGGKECLIQLIDYLLQVQNLDFSLIGQETQGS